ncbi:unnamed protein product [Trichogramma brassicae]|uniref:Uncharacterized protein n=1 Tax=Trichogramma brassicae TaxID=86971 RepID=A0A6H5IM16_9HYME|nr:unnamed protein product [Trichogramma brassicae]
MDQDDDQSCLIQLKALYEEIDWDFLFAELEQLLVPLIECWKGQLPNIRDIFSTGEVDLLLKECILYDISPRSVVDFLIRAGYKDEPPVDEDGKPLLRRTTPLHDLFIRSARDAEQEKTRELVRELFKIYDRFDANHAEERTGVTHFHVALSFGFYDLVEKFRELGPDPLLNGNPPLHWAFEKRKEEAFEWLLRNGADPNSVNEEKSTTLHLICKSKSITICDWAKTLFEICKEDGRTVQVNPQDRLLNTPLHLACSGSPNILMCSLLLKEGADPSLVNSEGSTALHLACKHRRGQDVAIMISETWDDNRRIIQLVNARDRAGNTPLHLAMPCAHKSFIKWLLEKGADPTATNATGLNPQHFIFIRVDDDKDSVRKLFEIGQEKDEEMQVDAQDDTGI